MSENPINLSSWSLGAGGQGSYEQDCYSPILRSTTSQETLTHRHLHVQQRRSRGLGHMRGPEVGHPNSRTLLGRGVEEAQRRGAITENTSGGQASTPTLTLFSWS